MQASGIPQIPSERREDMSRELLGIDVYEDESVGEVFIWYLGGESHD